MSILEVRVHVCGIESWSREMLGEKCLAGAETAQHERIDFIHLCAIYLQQATGTGKLTNRKTQYNTIQYNTHNAMPHTKLVKRWPKLKSSR